jgi:hypothetical protein
LNKTVFFLFLTALLGRCNIYACGWLMQDLFVFARRRRSDEPKLTYRDQQAAAQSFSWASKYLAPLVEELWSSADRAPLASTFRSDLYGDGTFYLSALLLDVRAKLPAMFEVTLRLRVLGRLCMGHRLLVAQGAAAMIEAGVATLGEWTRPFQVPPRPPATAAAARASSASAPVSAKKACAGKSLSVREARALQSEVKTEKKCAKGKSSD